jgi:hypothetical protein
MTDGVRVAVPTGVTRLAGWLATASPWRVLGLAALLRAAVTGIWTVPSIDQWLAFTRDPYGPVELHPDFRYITGSPLGPLLAHTFGAETRFTYGLLHLVLVAAAGATLVVLGRRTVGDRLTNVLVVLLFASPLSSVLLTWLGQPDPVTVGGLSVVGLASAIDRRPVRLALTAGAALLVGLASPEQGLVAVTILGILCWWGDRPGDREVVVTAAVALVVGRAGVAAFAAVSDAPHDSRLAYVERNGLGYFLRSLFDNALAVAWSVFAAGWLLVGHAFARLRSTFPNPWPVRLALLVLFAAVATTYDQTRVATLVSWPAAIWFLRRADAEGGDGAGLDQTLVAVVAILGLVVPPIVIWEGEPLISAWHAIRESLDG